MHVFLCHRVDLLLLLYSVTEVVTVVKYFLKQFSLAATIVTSALDVPVIL